MVDRLKTWALSKGYEIAWGPADVVEDVRTEIMERRNDGELDEQLFYNEWLSGFSYLDNLPFENPRSVIMVAIPRPAHTIAFTLRNGSFIATLPPTYVAYGRIRDEIKDAIAEGPLRCHNVAILLAPLKAVAARLGQVSYGRNNIAYTSRFGSYHQLVGLITDAELEPGIDRNELKPEIMEECQTCDACMAACPTGAIGDDRFLLHAERCLTLHNELTGEWPAWLAGNEHSCLVGCMDCQQVCPVNTGLLKTEFSGISFTAGETSQILDEKTSADSKSGRGITAKFERIGLQGYASVIGRNLKALVHKPESKEVSPSKQRLTCFKA